MDVNCTDSMQRLSGFINKRRALLLVMMAIAVPYGLLMLRFSLRNDQTLYFLPVRVYMRDAFLHHEFMQWNPFLSGSYPIHSDMHGSVWNPISILLTWLFNYNDTTFSIELLLYYLIGGVGCFYFSRNFSRNLYSCVVVAVIYGCGGFATYILEFMSWVSSLAFLPWAVHFFYLLLTRRRLVPAIGLAISLWLLLVCGYPSFLIYAGYCFVFIGLAYGWRLWVLQGRGEVGRLAGYGILTLLFFVLLSLPAIRSFYEYLPYYSRGTRTTDAHINSEAFAWNYPLSLLFPVAGTLVRGSDLYIGLAPLLILIGGRWKKPVLRFRDWVLLTGFGFTLLFALGRSTPVRMWSARELPLMDAFGFSHSVGVFLLFVLFIWLLPKLDILFSGERRLRDLSYAARVAVVVLLVYLVAGYGRVVFRTNLVRIFYYSSALWQLALLLVLCFSGRIFLTTRRLFFFILVDLVISVGIVAPLTGFTLTSPGVYNRSVAVFYHSDAGDLLFDTAAKMKVIRGYDMRRQVNAFKVTGRWDFPSHTRSDTFANYIAVGRRYDSLLARPFVFAGNGVKLQVHRVRLGYNAIDVDVEAADSCQMVLQQTWYKRWRSAEGVPSAYEGVFLSVPLKAGENRVHLFYYTRDLCIEAGVSILVLLVLIGVVIGRYWKRVKGQAGCREAPFFV